MYIPIYDLCWKFVEILIFPAFSQPFPMDFPGNFPEALIPGKAGRLPTNGMLQEAKKKVLGFLKREEAKD